MNNITHKLVANFLLVYRLQVPIYILLLAHYLKVKYLLGIQLRHHTGVGGKQ